MKKKSYTKQQYDANKTQMAYNNATVHFPFQIENNLFYDKSINNINCAH